MTGKIHYSYTGGELTGWNNSFTWPDLELIGNPEKQYVMVPLLELKING